MLVLAEAIHLGTATRAAWREGATRPVLRAAGRVWPAALMASLESRGQQTPIEVVELADGRFGLISGWRRLTALRQLQADEGRGQGLDTVLALLRRPDTASDAYVSMVEENEIRTDLSHFERGRIASTGSTSSSAKGRAAGRSRSRSRKAVGGRWLTSCA